MRVTETIYDPHMTDDLAATDRQLVSTLQMTYPDILDILANMTEQILLDKGKIFTRL